LKRRKNRRGKRSGYGANNYMYPPERKIGSSYNSGCEMTLSWNKVFMASAKNPPTITGRYGTNSVIADYPNWVVQVQNLWDTYRVRSVSLKFRPVANLGLANIFFPPMAVAQYTNEPPALTISSITALPWHRTFVLTDRPFYSKWVPGDDPDQFYFSNTTAAVTAGGIAFATASATPSAYDMVVMIIEIQAVIQVRGRRF